MSYSIDKIKLSKYGSDSLLCEPIAAYSHTAHRQIREQNLFETLTPEVSDSKDIRVVELFAGVGGFRIGLERASSRFKTVWSNQWEPSTKRQDASIVYCKHFGIEGHSNADITSIPTEEVPDSDLLCGGFPCQDYSVATTLHRSEGIEGKKGVLWWEIYRILKEKGDKRPSYVMLENVDRLLNSPAKQRGRDFAIILSSLSSLGYTVEWRVINAADYGMPQRRRRTYMLAYQKEMPIGKQLHKLHNAKEWILKQGVMAQAFDCVCTSPEVNSFYIEEDLLEVSEHFNKNGKNSPFKNAGVVVDGTVYTLDVEPQYEGARLTLGDVLVSDSMIPEEFYISDEDLPKWKYQKGAKSLTRTNKSTGFEYSYSEGAMTFPDRVDAPSRTIITGEGGAGASRFKHVIQTADGRYRRLVPMELERLNMFPDNHTLGVSDSRRAFLMGNALVTGIVERLGLVLQQRIGVESCTNLLA